MKEIPSFFSEITAHISLYTHILTYSSLRIIIYECMHFALFIDEDDDYGVLYEIKKL